MKADMHMHSTASPDAQLDPVKILQMMKAKGFGAVAILDHNTLKGTTAASTRANEIGILLIRGMEVSSEAGHIGALAVQEEIPKGLSAGETVDRIHSQGGLAVALHPYRMNTGVGEKNVRSLKFDAVEVVNGFTSDRRNGKALELANSLGLPCTAGSDAHFETEMGMAFVEIDECSDQDEFLKLLIARKSTPGGHGLSSLGAVKGAVILTWEWATRGFGRL